MPLTTGLRLSTDEDYLALIRAGNYSEAAKYAQWLYQDIFGVAQTHPEKSAEEWATAQKDAPLPQHERAGFFDAPISEEGIKSQADLDKLRSMFGTKGAGQAVQKAGELALTPVLGGAAPAAAEILPKAAKNFLASFGFGDREEARPDAPAGIKYGQMGAEIGLQLAPFMAATKALQGVKGFGTLGAKLFGAGTKGAHTVQAASTLGSAGGLTELGRQVNIDVMNQLGQTTQESDYGEVPAAALSFAAGGVPTGGAGLLPTILGRVKASFLQGAVSAAGQAAFLGDVDLGRVAMETFFAGMFGNPQFQKLRNQAVKITPKIADKIELSHNTQDPTTRVGQLFKDNDIATGLYVEQLSKQPQKVLDAMKGRAEAVGDEPAKRVIRDAIAEKKGDIVIGHGAPSGPVKPQPKPKARKMTNMDQVGQTLFEHPEGITTFEMSEMLGLPLEKVQRALRRLDNPHGQGRRTGQIRDLGGNDQGHLKYGLTEEAQGVHSEVDLSKGVVEELGRQMEDAATVTRDTTAPAPKKQVAQQELIRLSQMLDQVSSTGLDITKLNKPQAKAMIEQALEGRSKAEIDGWLQEGGELPDDLKAFRQAVTEVAGKLFRSFPEDKTVGAIRDASQPHLVEDSPRRIYTEDVPKDIETMRRVGAEWGIDIKSEGDGWAVYRQGRKRIGKDGPASIDDVHKMVNTIARGRTTTDKRFSFDAAILAARNKGWIAKHAGNKHWTVRDPESGAIHKFDTHEETFKFIDELPENYDLTAAKLQQQAPEGPPQEPVQVDVEPVPETGRGPQDIEANPVQEMTPEDTTALRGTKVAGTNVTLADDAAASALIPNDFAPSGYKKGEKIVQTPGLFKRNLTPLKDLFDIYSDLTGIPLFKQIWENTNIAKNRRDIEFSRPHEEALAIAHKGVDPWRYDAVHDLMMAKDMKDLAVRIDASPAEMKAALKMRDWYQVVFDLDAKQLDNLLHEGFPKIREVNGELHLLEDYTLPGVLAELLEGTEKGYLRLHDDSSMGVARDILHALGRKRYMAEPIKAAKAMEAKLISMAQKDKVNSELFTGAQQTVRLYMDAINNFVPNDAVKIADALTQWSGVMKKLKLIEGDIISPKDVERVAMMSTSWYGGLAMSWRAALIIRNLTQPLLAAPKLGYGNVAVGYAKAINAWITGDLKGLQKAGIIHEPAMFSFAVSKGARAGKGILQPTQPGMVNIASKLEAASRTLQSLGLKGYRAADQLNRAVTYFAGKNAVETSWAKFKRQDIDIDNFYLETGLAGESRHTIKNIVTKLGKGDIEGAAHDYGTHVSRSTQFLYSRADVPAVFQGVTARMFGQFGIWPLSFHSYIQQNAGGWHHFVTEPIKLADDVARKAMSPFGVKQRARTLQSRYRTQFATKMAAQWIALGVAGHYLGIDTTSWNKANPLAFTGGPALQAARDLMTVGLQASTQFERDRAWSALRRLALQSPNPFGGATNDVMQAFDEFEAGNDWEGVMELLGFNVPGGVK